MSKIADLVKALTYKHSQDLDTSNMTARYWKNRCIKAEKKCEVYFGVKEALRVKEKEEEDKQIENVELITSDEYEKPKEEEKQVEQIIEDPDPLKFREPNEKEQAVIPLEDKEAQNEWLN